MGITKTRMSAKHLCDLGKVTLNSKTLKPSGDLEGGEILGVVLPQKEIQLKVLQIPPGKSVAKQDRTLYCLIESTLEL
jgi:ribosomal 50S subunit-recycling heat shock protein